MATYKLSWEDKLPPKSLDICEENIDDFFYMMFERQEIWWKRFQKLPKPWSENELLRDYKFTNVYRELDRNSQYLISNVILDESNDVKELVWKIMLYKYFNNPDTFETFKKYSVFEDGIFSWKDWNQKHFTEAIAYIRRSGENPFTNAYLTNSQACPGWTRDQCFTQKVIPTLYERLDEIVDTCQNAKTPKQIIKLLMELPSVSGFLSHEFYQDFTYVPLYTDKKIMNFDQNDFTNVGPGAEIGIRMLFPSLEKMSEKEKSIGLLRDIAEERLKQYGDFKYVAWDKKNKKYVKTQFNLSLHNFEFTLCEFQKYYKMKLREGKQRSKIVTGSDSGKDYSFYLY